MACIGSQKCPPSHYMSATSLRPRDATPVLRRLAHAPPPVFSTGGDSHAHLLQRPSCRLVARMMTVSEDMYDNSPSRHPSQQARSGVFCMRRTVPASRVHIDCGSLCTTSRHPVRQRDTLFAARVSVSRPSQPPADLSSFGCRPTSNYS